MPNIIEAVWINMKNKEDNILLSKAQKNHGFKYGQGDLKSNCWNPEEIYLIMKNHEIFSRVLFFYIYIL